MATRPPIGSLGPELEQAMFPSARELRAQAVHRLQIGLFGLAAMLLLVGLANIIMERARLIEVPNAPPPVSGNEKPKSDPLADIGAVPSPEASVVAQPAR